jgi:hypothetical protein
LVDFNRNAGKVHALRAMMVSMRRVEIGLAVSVRLVPMEIRTKLNAYLAHLEDMLQ